MFKVDVILGSNILSLHQQLTISRRFYPGVLFGTGETLYLLGSNPYFLAYIASPYLAASTAATVWNNISFVPACDMTSALLVI